MTEKKPNFLFIMCDQLRWDYLGCAGHPKLKTPNIDRLAERGVNFTKAFVQSPVCGPSRASIYTGRTVHSHGSVWNSVPLSIAERTLGEYLAPAGYRTAVTGKTHIIPDREGLERLGITSGNEAARTISFGGFEPFDLDVGLHSTQTLISTAQPKYNEWLQSLGYQSKNPWLTFANSVVDEHGQVLSGWDMRSAKYPARVPKEHSETHYMTSRAIEFIDQVGDQPWMLHLSFIKPHWPYVAPAPYHALYSADDVPDANRADAERRSHPVFDAFMEMRPGAVFSKEDVRKTVIPAYMGLVAQIDDEVGRIVDYLDEKALSNNTVIVFTSDHGDYLGDHWMGEKELFHEESVRVPLIVMDPRPQADASRGSTVHSLVELIDLVPTFIELAGLPPDEQRLEGRSLAPFLSGRAPEYWRDAAFSELDYAYYAARNTLGVGTNEAKCFMVRTSRYKYVYYLGFPPQLFDLQEDPKELQDLGGCDDHSEIRAEMHDRLFLWLINRRRRTTEADSTVQSKTDVTENMGIFVGRWDEQDLPIV